MELDAATAFGAAGTGAQLGGTIFQALEAGRIGKYNQRIARANAQQQAYSDLNEAQQHDRLAAMLLDELDVVEASTTFTLSAVRERAEHEQGMAQALLGASGLAFTGSPLAVLDAGRHKAAEEALAVRYQGQLQLRAVREQETQERYAATLARFGSGERLRLGNQQAAGVGFETTERQLAQGFAGTGQALRGYETINYLQTRSRANKAGL